MLIWKGKKYICPVEVTMDIIGKKWKVLILWHLNESTKRFSELKEVVPGISQKMLAQQLKEMEEDGIIKKTIYPEIPPKVEYSVTEFGKTLFPLLKSMNTWAETYLTERGDYSGDLCNKKC
ncbi:transcriptional regulator, MarR family [Methanococcus maripaludis C5]|uniref:Transcriptional regulator, MarR family n=1 Tax=Methanococcus maripaludis (strain C5 / ATCC BAA-1333) TaxID=402880 RepID=A4FZ09_METM5|nr:helix-turn-helix domain-containing protein [Methanococcus maripaludis]ABO35443.1 transcriptional regulator, MarR family [Methanococcus maripaludis C5]